MKITVVGIGYVGLSNALLLANIADVIALDLDQTKVDLVNKGLSPIKDKDIEERLAVPAVPITATTDQQIAFADCDYVIVATPTDFQEETGKFNTSSVQAVAKAATEHAPQAQIVIKSTVPVGFTETLKRDLGNDNVFFSPEFLREGKALHDNLFPSRIVVGAKTEPAQQFASMLQTAAIATDIPVHLTGSTEAEAIKLFSNTYLAMRVAFFNELDNFALSNDLSTLEIINGVSDDPRIGNHYNNPSFGYGGYCLPKDSKQLLANYENVPQTLIKAIVQSNQGRKDFLADQIVGHNPKTVGIYRLTMKTGSDNFRESSVVGILHRLKAQGIKVIVHEPFLTDDTFLGFPVERDLGTFLKKSDLVVANRKHSDLTNYDGVVFTRDLFEID